MNTTVKTALALTALSMLLPGASSLAQEAPATEDRPTAEQLRPFQGSWEGVLVGDEESGKRKITITGNSLHFQRPSVDEWYDATFTLPAGTEPPQLHATITGSAKGDGIGTVVVAIFRIGDGTLTLVGSQVGDPDPPKAFGDKTQFKMGEGALDMVGLKPGTQAAWDDPDTFRFDFKKVGSSS